MGKYHYIPTRMAKMKKKTTANVGRDIEPLECLFVVGSVKCYNYFGKQSVF